LNPNRRRVSAVSAAALLIFAIAGCTGAGPTDIIIYETPTAVVDTPTPEPTPEPTPTPTPTPKPTPTPVPSPTATPVPTPTPTPGPLGPAGTCTGTAGNKDFFVQAAKDLTFTVYCPVLPSGWYLGSATYEQPSGGFLKATYKGPNGATFSFSEGAYCTTGAAACAPKDSALGTAKFGDMSGSLDALSGGFVVYVAPGTAKAYSATGKGMTQAQFTAWSAAMTRVPKS
jgi:hypothetical protein